MWRIIGPALCAFAIVLACGGAPGPSGTDSGASTGGTSTDATASTGNAPSTGEAPTSGAATSGTSSGATTTGAGPGSSATTGGETTTTAGTASATGNETASTGSTGSPTEPVTRAWWVDGNTLQIRVIQQDVVAGLCRGVILEALVNGGAESPQYEPVEQPADWGVRYVFVHAALQDCFDPYMWYENEPAYAESASGAVVFHDVDDGGKPLSLDMDVTGVYLPGEPWVPDADLLMAAGVMVEVG